MSEKIESFRELNVYNLASKQVKCPSSIKLN